VRTSRVLHCEAALVHFVLLHYSPWHEVHHPRRIPLHLKLSRLECPLLSDKNMEVIIRGENPRMSLRSKRRTEDDEVLGDARVDDIHSTHRPSGIVKYPFIFVGVESHLGARVCFGEVFYDVVNHAGGVIG